MKIVKRVTPGVHTQYLDLDTGKLIEQQFCQTGPSQVSDINDAALSPGDKAKVPEPAYQVNHQGFVAELRSIINAMPEDAYAQVISKLEPETKKTLVYFVRRKPENGSAT